MEPALLAGGWEKGGAWVREAGEWVAAASIQIRGEIVFVRIVGPKPRIRQASPAHQQAAHNAE
jgi:hypothetical protein